MRIFAGLVLGVAVVVLLGTLAVRAVIGSFVIDLVESAGRPAKKGPPENPFTGTD